MDRVNIIKNFWKETDMISDPTNARKGMKVWWLWYNFIQLCVFVGFNFISNNSMHRKWIIYNCWTDSVFGIAALCFPQTVSCCMCVVSEPCVELLIPSTRWTLTYSHFLVKNGVYFFTFSGFFFQIVSSLPWLWRLVAALTVESLVHSQPRPYGICGGGMRHWDRFLSHYFIVYHSVSFSQCSILIHSFQKH